MSTRYRNMSQSELDAGYNNSAAVANSAQLMAGFDALSDQTRLLPGAQLGLRYGPAPRNVIDYFAADTPGPLLVFVHGGYWQMRSKDSFSFLANGFRPHGIHVAMVGYTLAPEASLQDIVNEVRSAIRWLGANAGRSGADTSRIVVSGWSAGGHLTAMCMDEPGVVGGLAVSGIYDLEPVRLSYVNDKLQLKPGDVQPLSPLHLPLSSKPITVAYGGAELPELQRQSREFFEARAARGLPGQLLALPGLNHFTILADMARPEGAMAMAVKPVRCIRHEQDSLS